jgi:translation initiation factor IF-1
MYPSLGRTEAIAVTGTVVASLPNATFKVTLDNGHRVMAQTAGMIRAHSQAIAPGDKVTVELSPLDLRRGRITTRTR